MKKTKRKLMNKNNTANLICITQSFKKINHVPKRVVIFLAGWLLIMAAVLLTFDSSLSQQAQSLPIAEKHLTAKAALNGLTLMDTRCSVCHSADIPKRVKKTPEQWEQTVNRMIDKGAELSEDEKNVLLDYLSDTYGKEALK